MAKEKVVFIGDYNFPSDMAACNRVYYMAQAFQLAGYDTLVVGKGKLANGNSDINEYKGIRFAVMRRNKGDTLDKIQKYRKRSRSYTDALNKYASDAKYLVPYACSCPSHMKNILKFGREKNVKVVCDISEWYSFKQFKGIIGKIDYFIFQYAFRRVFYKSDKLICSSSFMRNYFIKKNPNILIVNGILDINEYQPKLDLSSDKCIMVYGGSPGKKDYLIQFLQVVDLMDDKIAQKINLKIIGITQRDISRLKQPFIRKYGQIEMIPRIPREKLIGILKNANYSLLLRPNKRYANAGFPSKLCESLSVGTPMMTNITSDIGDYLSDDNSIIIKDISTDSVADAIRRAIELDTEAYNGLRRKAFDIAKNNFSIEAGAEKLKAFLAD